MSSSLSSLVIRADATSVMGAGHVMRCLALAQTAQDAGISVCLVGRVGIAWLRERLLAEGIPYIFLDTEVPEAEDPKALLDDIERAQLDVRWVVLDGYHFGPDCQRAIRASGRQLLVIDDYNHLDEYDCDILLNQNLGAQAFSYKGNIGTMLLGPTYALLRREFLQARAISRDTLSRGQNRRVLVSLGGGNNWSAISSLETLLHIPAKYACHLSVIAGATPPHEIQVLLGGFSPEILQNISDMPGLLREVDICITAAGSTCWELCCLGVPFLAVSTAPNQEHICQSLVAEGLALACTPANLERLLTDPSLYTAMKDAIMQRVDGHAGYRVLYAMRGSTSNITLREATMDDSERVLELCNDPLVRKNSFSPHAISREEHERWFTRRITQVALPFYLAFCDDEFVGYARFDACTDKLGATISVAIGPAWRGKKIASELISISSRRAFTYTGVIHAWVKPDNISSQKAFITAGYIALGHSSYANMDVLCFQFRP